MINYGYHLFLINYVAPRPSLRQHCSTAILLLLLLLAGWWCSPLLLPNKTWFTYFELYLEKKLTKSTFIEILTNIQKVLDYCDHQDRDPCPRFFEIFEHDHPDNREPTFLYY